jgi:dTDP-4-dehydrorhamnose reductase
MLGSMLVRHLSQYTPVQAVSRKDYNAIMEPDSKLEAIIQGSDYVINAIGAIPQRCENTGLLYSVNAIFPSRLAVVAERCGVKVINISTDCVYSGLRGGYLETDTPDAADDYGKSKALGEISNPYVLNLRCSIVGVEPKGGYSLFGWFLSRPKKYTAQGYVNHFWNGITTLHFSKICHGIIEGRAKMVEATNCTPHIIPSGWVTKYQLLKLCGEYFNRSDITIKPTVSVSHGENNTWVDRRLATVNQFMNSDLWAGAGYNTPPTIEQMVKELAEYG